eukprot:3553279-Prymnesium_polylepis.1
MHWPAYMHFSSDHTHPRWRHQGHRRLKNVIVIMEWSPDYEAAPIEPTAAAADGAQPPPASKQLPAAQLSDGQRQRLARVFDMYDSVERSGALGEAHLRLVLREMSLAAETDASDAAAVEAALGDLRAAGCVAAVGGSADGAPLRVPQADFLQLMQAQRFLPADARRHWVALSLREAESLRGCLHACMDANRPLVPGARVSIALRANETLLDCIGAAQLDGLGWTGKAAPFVPPPRQQLLGVVQAYRFIDSHVSFSAADARLLLRLLHADPPADRARWFADVMACRRRPQGALQRPRLGVGQVLRTEDEYHLLVHAAT